MSLVTVKRPEDKIKLHKIPFDMHHEFGGEELFSLPRLAELACTLPGDKIEYSSGKANVNQAPDEVDKLDMTPEQLISGIEQHNAWMVIKRVESDSAYAQLVDEFIDSLADGCDIERKLFCDRQGFIFVSSANATTPFHSDAEENVLLQITGEKFFHVFDNSDRSLVSEQALEISPSKHRNLPYEESFEEKAKVFTLKPGDGLHVPYLAPHWVETSDTYSVSIAVTWKTPAVLRANKIRLMNGTLRKFRLPQKPPGVSPVMDAVKVFAHDAAILVLEPLRKSEKMRRLIRRIVYGREANYYYRDTAKNTE